ncbi:hypothetical protein TMatcc_009108 [Talaromyces marneffei ATCC 18224]|nr:uncharacterized protein EYB26_008390 [Talaromyces marneffei]QGA20684.1 hypothetical protein EYB26_008390 [Talaromyces marneffei]
MMASTPISMPLNILTKQQLKKSEDSLALSHISQCRNEPSPTEGRDDSALSLKQIPSLNNNSISSFTIGASWLTKSNSLHSSSSSVYSSSEPNNKRQYTMTTTNSETSARSSIISQSQESAKSTVSSVGVTSVSEDSQYSQKSAQQQRQHKQKRRGEGLKQALSLSSLQMRDSFERNPFKWLCRRSDASIQLSTSQLKVDQVLELEDQFDGLVQRKDVKMQPPQVTPTELGPMIVQRMERLEEKIDIFFSGLSTPASRSMRNTADATGLNPDGKKPSHNTYAHSQRNDFPNTKTDINNHLKILTAEINHLTKSNNNLSSCIDALGSSGLIDLLEMLSCSLERLYAAINSLRDEQEQQQDAASKKENSEQQLESQIEIIQRLGFLLGQREEQLKHERKLNQSYRKNIEGLEEMIHVLEEEWERALPLMVRSDVEGVSDVIGRLSRGVV